MLDWNDLRYFLAVAREGSTLAAARALGVDQATVRRRMTALEEQLGEPLMLREATGYRVTEFGRTMLAQAEQVEHAVDGFRQGAAASREAGVVRVTCPEPIVTRLKSSGLLERFHALHPGLRVEFMMSDRYLDLRKGEADVALRSGDTDEPEIVGRKIGDSLWAIYASRDYVERHRPASDLEALREHAWIGLEGAMTKHRVALWLEQTGLASRVVVRNTSVLGMLQAAKAGMGVAALPTAIADADPGLIRLLGPIDALARVWRVLTTPSLRHTPRVAAFFDFVVSEIDALQPVLTG